MPIFEYLCRECGTSFEKLVRNGTEVSCPGCGKDRLDQQYSTFAARADGGSDSAPAMPAGGCGGGMCQSPGFCNRN